MYRYIAVWDPYKVIALYSVDEVSEIIDTWTKQKLMYLIKHGSANIDKDLPHPNPIPIRDIIRMAVSSDTPIELYEFTSTLKRDSLLASLNDTSDITLKTHIRQHGYCIYSPEKTDS